MKDLSILDKNSGTQSKSHFHCYNNQKCIHNNQSVHLGLYFNLQHKSNTTLLSCYMLHKLHRILSIFLKNYIHIIFDPNQSILEDNRSFLTVCSMFLRYLLDKMCTSFSNPRNFHRIHYKSYKYPLHHQYI